jgi:SnoaL-like domain
MKATDHLLVRYFALLDRRATDELVLMFAPDGVMITKGGTGGAAVQGHDALRTFFTGRGAATSRHVVTGGAEAPGHSFAEGLVRPLESGETKFFITSALVDDAGRIARYTTLVWTDLSVEQEFGLLPRFS